MTAAARAWRFRDGLFVLLGFLVLYALFSVAHFQIVARTIGVEAYLGDGPRLPASLLLTSQAIKAAALMLALWLIGVRLAERGWETFGLRPTTAAWIAIGVAAGLVFFALRLGLAKAMVAALPEWAAMSRPPFAFGDEGIAVAALYFVMVMAVTPFAEEVFFRGFLFEWMASNRPLWLAALVSSAMFGVSHIVPAQAISAFLMAFVLIWLLRASGSIWPAVAAHAANNAVGVLLGAAAAAGALPAALTPPA